MNRETLHNIFKSPYQSSIWKGFLKQIFRDISASYFETPVDLKDDSLVKHKDVEHIWEYGDITLSDGRVIKFYEVELKENQQVTRNRVGLRNIMSSEIGFGYIDGAIITYYNKKASDWRFTFISKSLYWDADNNEVKTETHPKRYTYLLGENETVKTALNQFEWLFKRIKTRGIDLEDILKAFSVEKLSKEFYNGYFHQYETFVSYIVDNQKAFSHFLSQVSTNGSLEDRHKKAEHLVSDFVKKFLGRIVFLFFLQKKGWMGVPLDKDWGEGQLDFLFRLFEEFPDKNNFYEKALAPLFFETLNVDRSENNDIFSITNTRIPYLNGGLFEKDAVEPTNIQFEPQRFIDLLAFFSQYNFTVDESSPDDQDIGVDPEMLGHIFENLLEDNKDKGAFYTPKEIVHYMTQESLIEYLHTHLDSTAKENITIFVKQKKQGKLTENELEEINSLLSKVKILDPAIGSGAFPMGLLHEIFALKGLIAFEQGYEAWSPARVKERIIENSIYGVDIEEGAVDIAQLRFWLSLVVDEPTPRPLPNLDYKIICGNSLISRYDLDTPIDQVFREFNKGRAEEDKVDLAKYKALVNDYMHEANHDKKEEFKQLIEDVKNAFKTYFSSKESKKLNDKKYELNQYINVGLFEHKQTAAEKRRNTKLRKEIAKLEQEKKDREEAKIFKEAVEWRFEFPNLLDKEGNFEGFDIVIGNPPYIKVQNIQNEVSEYYKQKYKSSKGKYDIYVLFIEQSFSLLKENGNVVFINPHRFILADYGKSLRSIIKAEKWLKSLLYFGVDQIFTNATTYSGVFLFKKNSEFVAYSEPDNKNLNNLSFTNIPYSLLDDNWLLTSDKRTVNILSIINQYNDLSKYCSGIYQGIITTGDSIFMLKGRIEENVFIGYSEALEDNIEIEASILFPVLKGQDIQRYGKLKERLYVIFPHKEINKKTVPLEEDEFRSTYPKTFSYLYNFKEYLIKKKKSYKTNAKYWYSLHRSRELDKLTKKNKIITPQLQNKSSFTLDIDGNFIPDAGGYIVAPSNEFETLSKGLLSIFNSKLFYFFIKNTSTPYNNNYYYFKTNYIKPFKIPSTIENHYSIFGTLVDYILALKAENKLNEFVPNSHISETFEEVIDAMVFELYFPEEFKKAGLHFIKYAERYFESIEGKSQEEQTTIIHNAYQKLREKDNEIRNNLKAMKIELHDLLMPILTV